MHMMLCDVDKKTVCVRHVLVADIINCNTLTNLFYLVQMNSTLVDNDTLASLVQLYRQCKERGETVSLSLDTRWFEVSKAIRSYILEFSWSYNFLLPLGMEIIMLHSLSNQLVISMSEMICQKKEIQKVKRNVKIW